MDNALPSWNPGASKSAILDFVARVSDTDGADFVPTEERIATFDNDGTLWCEQPMQVQVFFAQHRLEQLAAKDPSMRERQPYKAFLERDMRTLAALGKKGLFEIAMTTHANLTTDEFDEDVRSWFSATKHPKLGRPFTECVYRPQLELLDFLRANGFKTFIVSGGGVDFMRPFAQAIYGIPPEQVIGSSMKTRFEFRDGQPVLVKLPELGSFDDRDAKPENIFLHIGRKPILAFGNSDGDLPMLRYTKGGKGPSLALVLHHDDAEREFTYDRDFLLSPLADALDHANAYGIGLVSMKHDWKDVF